VAAGTDPRFLRGRPFHVPRRLSTLSLGGARGEESFRFFRRRDRPANSHVCPAPGRPFVRSLWYARARRKTDRLTPGRARAPARTGAAAGALAPPALMNGGRPHDAALSLTPARERIQSVFSRDRPVGGDRRRGDGSRFGGGSMTPRELAENPDARADLRKALNNEQGATTRPREPSHARPWKTGGPPRGTRRVSGGPSHAMTALPAPRSCDRRSSIYFVRAREEEGILQVAPTVLPYLAYGRGGPTSSWTSATWRST